MFTFPEVQNELVKSYKKANELGFCLYFIGLSGSGKTTLANFIMSKLNELTNRSITYLDGDIVRQNLSQGLGFSQEDRSKNVRRIAMFVQKLLNMEVLQLLQILLLLKMIEFIIEN